MAMVDSSRILHWRGRKLSRCQSRTGRTRRFCRGALGFRLCTGWSMPCLWLLCVAVRCFKGHPRWLPSCTPGRCPHCVVGSAASLPKLPPPRLERQQRLRSPQTVRGPSWPRARMHSMRSSSSIPPSFPLARPAPSRRSRLVSRRPSGTLRSAWTLATRPPPALTCTTPTTCGPGSKLRYTRARRAMGSSARRPWPRPWPWCCARWGRRPSCSAWGCRTLHAGNSGPRGRLPRS
mmetsp:Transcript_14540/g.46405  ORF Transcript_14540/g.46405 Transcript_14540/m.46405 type:complete len:234 (-) Transcript_14540:254-955(-)